MTFLLSLFNRIWSEGVFPTMWRIALVIPILKPGKDASDPSSYRPIALTSCICKLLERIVNARLVWHLEKENIINESQYGFRRCRSTVDVLARIDTFIKIAFARKEHVVAVFFDIEKSLRYNLEISRSKETTRHWL
jgi:potassium voltage-gated channel Eag-related subfamily H protein 8